MALSRSQCVPKRPGADEAAISVGTSPKADRSIRHPAPALPSIGGRVSQ